jgi:pyridoxal phosphate enzyme (YggS family)
LDLPDPHALREAIRTGLDDVRARMAAARRRGAHAAPSVELVVVTKAQPPAVFEPLAALGARHVGENRVLDARRRRARAAPGLVWHGIGHVQRNKAAAALEAFDVFHALDSLRLADRFEGLLAETGRRWPVHLQVEVAGDGAKGGVPPDEALAVLADLGRRSHLRVVGFMTMAAQGAEDAALRRTFRTLRELRDEALRRGIGDGPPEALSMGMTDDFEVAIEEGATRIRVGRAVFAGVTSRGPRVAAERDDNAREPA